MIVTRIAPTLLAALVAAGTLAAETGTGATAALPIIPTAGPTLREAAGSGLLIGCSVESRALEDPRIATMVARQFSCLTADNEMMPALLVDEAGQSTFERGDRIAAFAQAHRLPLFGHMLVWHHVTRDWLFKDAQGNPLSRDEALANLRRYIETVAGHYRGKVVAWDVVNEALSDQPDEYLRATPALRAIGEDYIEKAFEFARAAAPDAELYYNDYNIEEPGKRAKALRLVRSLQARGGRIDAIGIQGHWNLHHPAPATIADAIREFHATGLKVLITELDVDVLPRTTSGADLVSVEEGPNPYPEGLPAEVQQQLAARYREIFTALLRPPGVAMITFWGSDDGHTWLNDYPVKRRTNHPLLFDRAAQPKPAFQAVIDVLRAANPPAAAPDAAADAALTPDPTSAR